MNKKLFSVVLAVLMMAVCVSGVMAQDTIKIGSTGPLTGGAAIYGNAVANARSEERRVGKECRSRWSPDH